MSQDIQEQVNSDSEVDNQEKDAQLQYKKLNSLLIAVAKIIFKLKYTKYTPTFYTYAIFVSNI